ncbi:MAG TPA: alpha/beta fold hydrolase [Gemmatales bacterium]|nr:alpha/beta fold hydrolase [Gemmatales bacterium]HMP58735.1 alpha/beta fold hydrolase [Gemmatales bacterium]
MINYKLRSFLLLAATILGFGIARASIADETEAERYLFPAKDVDPAVLKSNDQVVVTQTAQDWSFTPAKGGSPSALLFFPGGGVEPVAYAPLARAIAADGWAVYVVKLPGKTTAAELHRQNAIALGKSVMSSKPEIKHWVVAGHSMGGSIAARFVHEEPSLFRGLILIGTTHPRDFDLSGFTGEVTKVYGTEDKVAQQAQSEANRRLLPARTTWVRVEGGNHAQFGSYGLQPGDGRATISREEQLKATCNAVVSSLRRASASRKP